ncbi:unnamed protein product [Ectocarpus sp. CCAP 1310/34]|nr:unnamed protein product [Ectocarpus sp. CCAP 1310/34]
MRLGEWTTAVIIASSQVMSSAAFLATPPPPNALLLQRPSPAATASPSSTRSEFQLHAMVEDSMLSRSGLMAAGLKAAAAVAASAAAGAAGVSPASAAGVEPEVTSKCFIEVRIMEPLNEANGYSSKNAFKGRLVFGVYGKESPKAAENFLRYVRADRSNGEPSYASGQLTKMEPGVFLEGGKIAGLNIINIGGQEELEYGGEVVAPLPSLLEASSNNRPHDRRGLLTRDRLSRGPEFGITLGAAPALDGSHEVFGRLLQGEDVLARLEKVPVYGGQSRLEEGSLASDAFKAQNRALVYIGKNVFRDERAVDRTGSLMRRVDILSCGML